MSNEARLALTVASMLAAAPLPSRRSGPPYDGPDGPWDPTSSEVRAARRAARKAERKRRKENRRKRR